MITNDYPAVVLNAVILLGFATVVIPVALLLGALPTAVTITAEKKEKAELKVKLVRTMIRLTNAV